MNADKSMMVGGCGDGPASLIKTQAGLAFAFIGVHRRSSAVPSAFD
jgi:hypothetical protein